MELLTTKQAAVRLGLSARSISTMAAAGKIRCVRMGPKGGMVRFTPEDLDAYSARTDGRLSEIRGRIPQPWFRAATNSWYVWLEGWQIPLGKIEQQARKTFRRLTAGKRRDRPARLRTRPRSARIDQVYFIQDVETGAIKIGVSLDPKARLSQLQIGHPYQLILLGVMPGSRREEVELHVMFERFHIRGEWFRGDDALLSAIRALIGQRGHQC